MKALAIGFAICITLITTAVIWTAMSSNDARALNIGSFLILSLTLVVLVWYAYDTNSLARVTRERWMREGGLSTSYNMQLIGEKGDPGRTLFQLHNPSTLIVRAKVACNFRVYDQPVSWGPAYDGEENWVMLPHQMIQGWFDIDPLLKKKGKSVASMIAERTPENQFTQLTMALELEFWDELGTRRKLPPCAHYFDFERWAWIPHITERVKS